MSHLNRRMTRKLRCVPRSWCAVAIAVLGIGFVTSSPAAEVRTLFDHLTTGFELIGQHRDLPCES